MGWLGIIAARLLGPLVSFLITILVARLWGKLGLAQCATVWSWLAISQYFSVFGLPDFIAKEAGRSPAQSGAYLKHGLVLIGSSACITMLLLIAWAAFSGYSSEVKVSLMVAGLSLPAAACIAMCQAICTALKRIPLIILSLAGESLIFLAGALAVLYLGGGLLLLFASLVAARTVTAVVYGVVIRKQIGAALPRFDLDFCRTLVRGAAVFGLTGVCGLVFLRLDIVVLSLLCDLTSVGVYSAAAKIPELCLIFPLTFYFLNLAPAAQFFHTCPNATPYALQRTAAQLFYVVLGIVSGGMLFAETVLGLLYGPAYVPAANLLRSLLLVFMVMSAETVLTLSCQAAGYHWAAMWIALGRLGAGLTCQYFFVKFFGVGGAPFATLVAMLVSFTATCILVEKRVTHLNWAAILSQPVLVCFCAASAVLLLPPGSHLVFKLGAFCGCFLAGVALLEWPWRLLQRRNLDLAR